MDFYVGNYLQGRKIHPINQTTVFSDKKVGNLDIKKFSTLNIALLGKWSWGFANERKNIWSEVIKGKSGQVEGSQGTQEVKEHMVLGWGSHQSRWDLFKL